MEILERHAQPVQAELHAWAARHAQVSGGLLVPLEIEPETYPHQKIMAHTVTGNPLEPGAIDSIAEDVDSRYPAISDAIEQQTNAPGLHLMGEVLDSRHNIVLGTDHAELVDIALMLAKVTTKLRLEGYEFDSSILVNKMVAFLGVDLHGDVIPATNLLGMAFDAIYMSIPNTATTKLHTAIPGRVIGAYNGHMIRHGVEKRMRASRRLDRAMLMGVALSGTVNKPLDRGQPETEKSQEGGTTFVLGRANTGSLKFMKEALTVAAGARLDNGQVLVDIDNQPYSVRTQLKLDQLMHRIAAIKNNQDPDNTYVYDQHGSLPVIR